MPSPPPRSLTHNPPTHPHAHKPPQGICENCYVNRQPCTSYPAGKKPVGCQEDTSWTAFVNFGWKLRFLDDYLKKGAFWAAPSRCALPQPWGR